jgi:AraC family transcriptional regulator of adaptative response/methylated-DNA-[protein]-cysteine methyltransferase
MGGRVAQRKMDMETTRGALHYFGRNGLGQLRLGAASYGYGGRGARMGRAIADSPFGPVLAAATPNGLTWLGIHDSTTHLESELHKDYPGAEFLSGDRATEALVRDIFKFVTRETAELELPIDIRATAFQGAVWSELCAIPRGVTRSYGEIARRIGRPDAARAVGHANGSNPIAIVVPCHRALGADGSLTGYRWGLECKRRLLEYERAVMRIKPSSANQPSLPFP